MAPQETSTPQKVIILGAGLTGLAAAKTYLQIKPDIDLTIIDSESEIGGVWSAARIYPGLIFEVPTPMAEFSDLDMLSELGLGEWNDITGEHMNEYLLRYVEKFNLGKHFRLNTKAVNITRSERGWNIVIQSTNDPDCQESLSCDKLIIATGINSHPKIPDIDMSTYTGVSMHSISIASRYKELLTEDIKTVTVVGGHKSALEAVGLCAQAGKTVNWLVRKEGGGSPWMLVCRNPDGSSPVKAASKRVVSVLSPSIYNSEKWWINRFLYSGRFWLGTWLMNWFWRSLTNKVKGDRYSKSENCKKLEPAVDSMFWFIPGGTTIHDRDTETLRLLDEDKLIHVERDHAISAKDRTVTLSNGTTIASDAIVFCTGWDLGTTDLFTPSLAHELGIPSDPATQDIDDQKYWAKLDEEASNRVLSLYPMLQEQPQGIQNNRPSITPFRLFRSIVPPKLAAEGDRSIMFIGNAITGRAHTNAEISSMWGIAYLENLLPIPITNTLSNKMEMDSDIAHVESFRKNRYLGWYATRTSVFETGEYLDQMLHDLGLRSDRKRMKIAASGKLGWGVKAWFKEWFDGYFADDYRGIVDEFLQSLRIRENGVALEGK